MSPSKTAAPVGKALSLCSASLDPAEALHDASDRDRTGMASFGNRKFAGQAKKFGLTPAVVVPT